MKRTAIILLMSMVVLISSCAKNSDKETANNDSTTSATEVSEIQGDTTQGRIEPDLPDIKFDGHNFTFLISSNNELNKVCNDIHSEGETGEVINDERYRRNTKIEDTYNITIKDIETAATADKGFDAVKKSVMAGDNAYDAAFVAGYASCKLASGGYLYDLNTMPHINLKNPWWDQKANADLTIKDKMYYTTGDISTANNDATYCILFNKKLARDYALGDFYDIVRKGEWTIDKFVEISSQVHKDLNGDDMYDTNDLFGALIWDDTMMGVINAAGEKCSTIQPDGNIELTMFNPKVVSMIEKYLNYACDTTLALTYQRKNWDGVASNNMFANDQALFYVQILKLVTEMRGMANDFGILPYFKYSSDQKEYYNTVGSWHSVFVCVPSVQENAERTGIILEALAAESKYTVRPAYIDVALKGKHTRDDESLEMLDIILSTRTYDVGWLYAVGGYNEEVMNLLRNFKKDFTSMYEKREAKALTDIEKLNTTFAEIIN